MNFNETQIKELEGPLNAAHVKQRKNYGGGPALSYIESWVAISEANRIFGHDGWSSETVQIERIATTPYTKKGYKGGDDIDMIAVSYMARVRVSAGGVVREGCGYGDGQAALDKAGAAHELALKEAESDARKRALMTFGNPFGLALYDKEQANVKETQGRLSKAKARDLYNEIQSALDNADTLDELGQVFKERVPSIKTLPLDWEDAIVGRKDELKEHLSQKVL